MSVESVTFSLPSDAAYQTAYDDLGNPYYIITTSKANAPYLANLALESLTSADQKQIPSGLKERIIEHTGIKYVFTLPSALRCALTGVAAGITIKTLSNADLSPALQDFAEKIGNAIAYAVPFSTQTIFPAVTKGIEAIKSSPYLVASVLAGASIATRFVPESVSLLAADTAEGTLSFAKKVGTATIDTFKAIGNFCMNNPKTAITTVAAGVGYLFREKLGLSR